MTRPQPHIPVLLQETISLLNPQLGEIYFDGTAGYGGHASAVAKAVGPSGHLILVDRDSEAIGALQEKFGQRAEVVHSDFASAAAAFRARGRQVDMALLDLGVSSPQLDRSERGFSFRTAGPLDMRMDTSEPQTAADVVNSMLERELADILYQYGEERRSRAIAKAIVRSRPLQTTEELANTVTRVLGRGGDIHPATRTFQALRIYLNQELQQLRTALPEILELLTPGGRMAVISFHSLEDRIVKEFFNRESRDCICPPPQPVCTCSHQASVRKLTKKAVAGTEDAFNPRARSAKLRAAVKIKNQKEQT